MRRGARSDEGDCLMSVVLAFSRGVIQSRGNREVVEWEEEMLYKGEERRMAAAVVDLLRGRELLCPLFLVWTKGESEREQDKRQRTAPSRPRRRRARARREPCPPLPCLPISDLILAYLC